MSGNDKYRFSPLFRVRKLLFVFRWFLGFPLKAKNKACNEFEFQSSLEYTRYFLFLCFFFLTALGFMYPMMKGTDSDNPFAAIEEYFKSIGFTRLDIFVFMSMPQINLVSSFLYLASFKKEATRISKVCVSLTDLNKTLWDLSDKTVIRVKQFRLKRSLKLVIFGICISIVIMTSFGVTMFIVMQTEIFSKLSMSNVQTCLYLIDFVIYVYCATYPCITISADFIICHLVNEIGELFSKWNDILKLYIDQRAGTQMFSNWRSSKDKTVDRILKR